MQKPIIGLFDVDGKITYNIWAKEEIKKLKQNYHKSRGIEELLEMFPNRTIKSIYDKASALGLKRKTSRGFCRRCNIKLILNKNWYMSSKDRADHICKNCIVKENRERREENPKKYKEYYSNNQLHTNGKTYLCRKREKPSKCELCGSDKRIVYHHYGNIKRGKKVKGIWICLPCHYFIEKYESGYLEKYLKIKEMILNEKNCPL